ncbi:hypothetical protein [Streptomyces sp. NPDC018833]
MTARTTMRTGWARPMALPSDAGLVSRAAAAIHQRIHVLRSARGRVRSG